MFWAAEGAPYSIILNYRGLGAFDLFLSAIQIPVPMEHSLIEEAMTETPALDLAFLLSRLDEEAGLSDEEILEESRQSGETPALAALAVKKVMFEGLPTAWRMSAEAGSIEQRLRPLLLLTLSKLASIGITCPPADGLRLIRDFLRNEWPDLGWKTADTREVVSRFLSFAHKTAYLELA